MELTLSSIDPKNRTKCVDLARSTFPLPQAGIVVFLPLENGAFDTNTIEASFHPSALATFDHLTDSQPEAASGTLVAITDSGSQMATEARNAEILGLQTQVQELELRQKLRALEQQENAR